MTQSLQDQLPRPATGEQYGDVLLALAILYEMHLKTLKICPYNKDSPRNYGVERSLTLEVMSAETHGGSTPEVLLYTHP